MNWGFNPPLPDNSNPGHKTMSQSPNIASRLVACVERALANLKLTLYADDLDS